MIARSRSLPLALLAFGFALVGCEQASEPKQEMSLEKAVALVGELGEELDIDYAMSAEVWDGQIAVVRIDVDDPSSDYQSEVKKFPGAQALSKFDGKVLVVFLQNRPITAEERTAGQKASSLILAKFDARTGERQ